MDFFKINIEKHEILIVEDTASIALLTIRFLLKAIISTSEKIPFPKALPYDENDPNNQAKRYHTVIDTKEKTYNITIVVATNRTEAVACYNANQTFVLMDQNMPLPEGQNGNPDEEGAKTTEEILKKNPDAIVIAWSTSVDKETKDRALKSGAEVFYSKPPSLSTMEAIWGKVEKIIEEKKQLEKITEQISQTSISQSELH